MKKPMTTTFALNLGPLTSNEPLLPSGRYSPLFPPSWMAFSSCLLRLPEDPLPQSAAIIDYAPSENF